MARRNYNAFIKAARRTGGLSFPAARKAYTQVSERLSRKAKGNDVKAHPRIFRETISTKGGKRRPGFADTNAKRSASGRQRVRVAPVANKAARGSAANKSKPSGQTPAQQAGPSRLVLTKAERLSQDFVEYVSTPEYTKRGPRGSFRLQLQIHVTGPPGLTKRRLDRIAVDWLGGKETPNGIEVKALGWNGKNPTTDGRGMRVARSNFRYIPFEA